MIGLIDTATVYTEDANGVFTVVAADGLRCRRAHVNSQPATSGAERADLAAIRNLIWQPDVYLPEHCQIRFSDSPEIWNPVGGSFKALSGPSGALTYRCCDIVRAVNG